MRNRAGKRSQFPAGGAGLWRPSPTEGVVPRKQLKVYFFLPHARPVPLKVGLELNRPAVGKTANSLVSPRRQQLTPLPCGGPARLDRPLEPRRSAVLISALAMQGGGSDRFWARELRVSQHFSTFYGSS